MREFVEKIGMRAKKGKKGVEEERKENISPLPLLTCFTLMPTLILNKFARKRVLRRLGEDLTTRN